MEGHHENTKKGFAPCMMSLVPSTLPLFAPATFPVPKKPHSFTNRVEAMTPFSYSSNSQDSSLQHDENFFVNCIGTDNAINIEMESADGCNQLDTNMDPKKFKRIISNRVSAKKFRIKKLRYVSDMERKAKALEAKIAILHPQVVMHRKRQHLLEIEYKRLIHEISTCKTKKLLKDGEIEENRAEVNRLRRLYLEQGGENIDWNNYGFDPSINIQYTTRYMDLMLNSNQGKVEEKIGEETSEDWSKKATIEDIWNPDFEAALRDLEDNSTKFIGIEQILNP